MTVPGLVQLSAPATSYSTEFVELDPEDGSPPPTSTTPRSTATTSRSTRAPRPRCRRCSTRSPTTATRRSRWPARCRPTCAARSPPTPSSWPTRLPTATCPTTLADFLETKRGYCVQFASAMVMLARAAGIPARMAVGYLPGSIDGDDPVYASPTPTPGPSVLPTAGLGAVRADPGHPQRGRAGVQHRVGRQRVLGQRQPDHVGLGPLGHGLHRAVARRHRRPDRHHRRHHRRRGRANLEGHLTTILVVLLAILLAAIVPLGAWLSRRRARGAAGDTPSASRRNGSHCCCACRTSGSSRPTAPRRARRPGRSVTTPTSPPTRTTPSVGWSPPWSGPATPGPAPTSWMSATTPARSGAVRCPVVGAPTRARALYSRGGQADVAAPGSLTAVLAPSRRERVRRRLTRPRPPTAPEVVAGTAAPATP